MRYTTASQIEAAVRRLLRGNGNIVLSQVRNGTGYARSARTADMMSVSTWPSRGMYADGIEIKRDRGDLRSELANPQKADDIAKYCRHWYLAVPDDLITEDIQIPETWGVISVNDKGVAKITKRAAELDAQPFDTLFTCAVLRNFAESHTPNDEVEPKVQDAVKKAIEQEKSWQGSRLKELEAGVAAFKEHSGIDLMGNYGHIRWDMEDLGQAIKLVLEFRNRPLSEMLDARKALLNGAAAIEMALGNLMTPAVPR